MPNYPQNLRRMRLQRKMTLAETARAAETTPAQVMKLENGDRRLTLDWLERLCRAYGCAPIDIVMPRADMALSGLLDGNWIAQPAPPDRLESLGPVMLPRDLDPAGVVAVRTDPGNADLVFFCRSDSISPAEAAGRLCLIGLTSGPDRVRHVRRTTSGLALSGPCPGAWDEVQPAERLTHCRLVLMIVTD